MREELDRNGYLVLGPDGKPGQKIRIGAGTDVPSAPATCYEINYRKMFDGTSITLVQNDNGVQAETAKEATT